MVLGVLFLLFLAMFSIDVIGEGYGFWGTVVGLFMHNIPVMILGITLWVSLKKAIVGGVVFILAGVVYMGIMIVSSVSEPSFEWYMLTYPLIIAGPAWVIGILFLRSWYVQNSRSSD